MRPRLVTIIVMIASILFAVPSSGQPDAQNAKPGEIVAQHDRLAIAGIHVGPAAQGRIELDVDLKGTWDNPFDPDDVRLDATVTPANGRSYAIPGFFLVDYSTSIAAGAETLIPSGNGRWRVRIASDTPGSLHVRLVAKDRTGSVVADAPPILIASGANRGFIHASRVDPHGLQFDNGDGFVPIGHNYPFAHMTGQTAAETIRKMAANGENYNRFWMSNSVERLGLEIGPKIGWYNQQSAARLDNLVELAGQLNFYYMLCLGTFGDFRDDAWAHNPYNVLQGGPCATVSDWFTDPAARKFYKKRLRYIVARWGYSTNILCWELGNEWEGVKDASDDVKLSWHKEMAAYLADLDPYRHLISTSSGGDAYWRIPQMTLVQTHEYADNDGNSGDIVHAIALDKWNRYDKPHLFGEFGVSADNVMSELDPDGWGIHNAVWAGLCSGVCGVPMNWWHESYIDPKNLYPRIAAVARFRDGLPFGSLRWEQIRVASVRFAQPDAPQIRTDIVLAPSYSFWTKQSRPVDRQFVVSPDGAVSNQEELPHLLHARSRPDLYNPATFAVTYPGPGVFSVGVGKVSREARIVITIDGAKMADKTLIAGKGLGLNSAFHKPDQWTTSYFERVSVNVPAGRHLIQVSNQGKDWALISSYLFGGCRVGGAPDLLVAGLRTRSGPAIVWLQNRQSDWFNHSRNAVVAAPPALAALAGFARGRYRIEWWDTWNGRPLRSETLFCDGKDLTLAPGAISSDIAAKIIPLKPQSVQRNTLIQKGDQSQ